MSTIVFRCYKCDNLSCFLLKLDLSWSAWPAAAAVCLPAELSLAAGVHTSTWSLIYTSAGLASASKPAVRAIHPYDTEISGRCRCPEAVRSADNGLHGVDVTS